jgi:signal transduction histidine kinase
MAIGMIDQSKDLNEQESQGAIWRQYHELAELAGSLAHEIKNPLSVIHMNADLLSEELDESQWPGKRRAISKVDMIKQQCHRMENLLRDFLRFARMQEMELTLGSLNEQITSVLNLFQAQADKQSVRLERFLDADLPNIRLNGSSLQAALINLVKNAREALVSSGKSGDASPRITLRAGADAKGKPFIEVKDNGPGIAAELLDEVFILFFTTEPSGTGVGLSISKQIM